MEKKYNIHDLLGVDVSSNFSDIIDGYNHYIRHFLTEKEVGIDYEIFDFEKLSKESILGKVGDFLKIKNGVCFPEQKYAIAFSGGKIQEYTEYANHATNLLIQTLLLKKNCSFVHSAGVELDGRGIIFPAIGGVGKTILMSALRDRGDFKFFGDDYSIVSSQGEMYSYPSDFSIYPYHIPLFPELKNSPEGFYLRRRKIFKLYYELKRVINFIGKRVFGIGHPLLKGWCANYVKVPARKLIPVSKIGRKTALYASIFLERYEGREVVLEKMDKDALVNKIIAILNLEFGESMNYCSAAAALGEFNLLEFQAQQKRVLSEAFSAIDTYSLQIPSSMSPKEYCSRIPQKIEDVIRKS